MVTVVEPQTVPAHAVKIAVPGAIPKTTPLFEESFIEEPTGPKSPALEQISSGLESIFCLDSN